MTQVYTGTLTSLGWQHTEEKMCLRQPEGAHLYLNVQDFERDFIALGHIDHLPPHVQRMIAEHAVNKQRLTKLNAFFDTELYKGLGEEEQLDQAYQAQLMHDLDVVLTRRIERAKGVAQPHSTR